jgi:hypothetical protein
MMTIKEGDRVMYAAAWGTAAPVPGTITDNGEEHKGRAAWGVELDDGTARWGYANQFTILEG